MDYITPPDDINLNQTNDAQVNMPPMPTADDVVFCSDDFGQLVPVEREALLFRPAVYGILLENTQVLLHAHARTGRWHLPGGFVEREQAPDQALRLHFRSTTGMMPVIQSVAMVDDLFYYDGEQGYRLSALYYLVGRPSAGLANLIDFNNEARPEWVSLSTLDRLDMQFGFDAIQNAQLITQK